MKALQNQDPNITLRKAKEEDFESTFLIKCRSIKPYVEKIWSWDDAHQRTIHQSDFAIGNTTIIEYRKQDVGFFVLRETEDKIYLENFLISSEFQNFGIGKKVMKELIKKAASQEIPMHLQVFKINTKAQRFYKNLGFKLEFEKEKHLVMIKNAPFSNQ